MAQTQKPKKALLRQSISTCIENGDRLLQESYDLEFRSPSSLRYFIVTIAQEEFAKAFLLFLIVEDILHFDAEVQRAMKDHACKHLVGMWMDYIILHWDEFEELERAIALDVALGQRLPNDVGSAAEILRYDKIGRWKSRGQTYLADPPYDRSALAVAEGKKDKRKQDALYVRIGRDGRVASTPANITDTETTKEFERAERYRRFVVDALAGKEQNFRYEKLLNALRHLFALPSPSES
jgi:AbiV family abortive infection protein